ncbi:MAG: tRNA (adenosine(37)-N6)-threonylcarbamoyltransferase complex dimerization subunit type 1 TsaB [Gammaproteobacteria bacterium]|nr:tRNA (adenosine(37)-N6)-threonylcarbamoyltransferase complex dimerization subunit type 1 TsaB [Gammaproteobacteria bacterium]
MTTILTIDTSSSNCTVVLASDGQHLESVSTEPRSHAKQLLSMVNKLLVQANIDLHVVDAFGVVSGPGSFTGLRIGVGSIQGLAFGLNKPVVLLSSLELLATQACLKESSGGVLVVTKARSDEVYFASYKCRGDGIVELVGKEQVVAPDAMGLTVEAASIESWCGVGDGWQYHDRIIDALGVIPLKIDDSILINTQTLADLACLKYQQCQFVAAEHALPCYIKDQLDYRKSNQGSSV